MQLEAIGERARTAAVKDAGAVCEFLTFRLADEAYGVDILKVQEIRGYNAVTRIPDAPAFVKGVLNLRGVMVPVMDLRLKFNLPKVEYDDFTVMIILNLADRVVGVVVDRVSDVVALPESQIFDPPALGRRVDSACITGLGTLEDRMLILLDVERLMSSEDMQVMHPVAQ